MMRFPSPNSKFQNREMARLHSSSSECSIHFKQVHQTAIRVMNIFVTFAYFLSLFSLVSAYLVPKFKANTCSSLFAKAPEKKFISKPPAKSTYSKPRISNKPSPIKKEAPVKEASMVESKENDESDVKGLVKLDDDERLQKVIARAGIASRRKAEQLVRPN